MNSRIRPGDRILLGNGFAAVRLVYVALALVLASSVPRIAGTADVSALPAEAKTNRYEFRAQHDPNGIGKFYMGREIAWVMGHESADWLERPERNTEEDTDRLVEELGIIPGQVVADIGAGTGYLSRRLAKKVGSEGRVFAEDIQPEMLSLLASNMARAGISNVTTVLGTAKNPKLPIGSVGLAIMVDVYHEFDFPLEMMQGICESLKPGGRVVFVEFRAEDEKVPIKAVHKMTEAQVKREMAALPLEWMETREVLPWQHIIVFRRRPNVEHPTSNVEQ